MADMLFIYNPKAGKQAIKGRLSDILSLFCREGHSLEIYCTQAPGDARRFVREEGGRFPLICCSGGDGTLNEVVSGQAEGGSHSRIGYLACGSTNDYSVNLCLPKDLLQAAEVAVTGRPVTYDIGRINDRHFVYCAAFGIFTSTSYSVSQDVKNRLGHAAYVLDGIKQMADVVSYPITVRHDDREITGDFIYGMITNSTSVGGFHGLGGKDVEMDDGRFELCLVRRPKTVEQLNEILTGLILGSFDNNPSFYTAKVSELRLESDSPIAWALDGEFGGQYRTADIAVLPRRLTISSGL